MVDHRSKGGICVSRRTATEDCVLGADKTPLPIAIGLLELLGIPGRWGRIDAFGRGRVEAERR